MYLEHVIALACCATRYGMQDRKYIHASSEGPSGGQRWLHELRVAKFVLATNLYLYDLRVSAGGGYLHVASHVHDVL